MSIWRRRSKGTWPGEMEDPPGLSGNMTSNYVDDMQLVRNIRFRSFVKKLE